MSLRYYAMFYVALAFLGGEGMSFKNHKGVLAAFGRDIAQAGKVPEDPPTSTPLGSKSSLRC
ncbi:hypothetical protein H6G17_14655 [Chroococcidiopsis sp. FACHB-1243]|uniref:hypothetical protein n=1 Tax=Chroococcidiopsis sp. [FACHB-1243] TaxID=2692781 RepID=UPI00178767C0|nr:hypothetical protein [Chroococcidiopsis sp. [FACHB-1243]]MBD2306746.1 hypothetical protein [Chroococcidiopsis sp. [FACHB-1243]]